MKSSAHILVCRFWQNGRLRLLLKCSIFPTRSFEFKHENPETVEAHIVSGVIVPSFGSGVHRTVRANDWRTVSIRVTLYELNKIEKSNHILN